MDLTAWKIMAIISSTLLVLETLGVIFLISSGVKEINKSNKCYDLCYELPDAVSWDYVGKSDDCYCNMVGGEVKRIEV